MYTRRQSIRTYCKVREELFPSCAQSQTVYYLADSDGLPICPRKDGKVTVQQADGTQKAISWNLEIKCLWPSLASNISLKWTYTALNRKVGEIIIIPFHTFSIPMHQPQLIVLIDSVESSEASMSTLRGLLATPLLPCTYYYNYYTCMHACTIIMYNYVHCYI